MHKLFIGLASREITPQKQVEMCGYGYFLNRVFQGVADPLYVRSVAFVQNERRFLLVNCDLEGIDTDYYDKIKDSISKKLNLSPDDMLLAVIHTHSGPAFHNLVGAGQADEETMEWIGSVIIDCACEAFSTLREVTDAKVSSCTVPDLSIERTGSGAPINQSMHALTFEFGEGRPLVLLNFGCHPVAADANDKITADYPGAAVRAMEELGYDALLLVAFCGNINPPKKGEGCVERGRELAQHYKNSLAFAKPLSDLTLKSAAFDEYFKLRVMPKEEVDGYINYLLKATNNNPGFARVLPIWKKVNDEFHDGIRPDTDLVHVRFLTIGNVMIVGFSAEMISDLSFIIEKAFPEYTVFTMGNLFDTRRYLASTALMDRDTYEVRSHTIGYHTTPIVRGEAERVVNAACDRAKRELN